MNKSLDFSCCFFILRRGNATKGNYELKANRLSEYNQFYYHYTKADQCKVSFHHIPGPISEICSVHFDCFPTEIVTYFSTLNKVKFKLIKPIFSFSLKNM